ncbi:hypothetical protein VTO58DRAFT_108144 [Aureobasidium pullulans]
MIFHLGALSAENANSLMLSLANAPKPPPLVTALPWRSPLAEQWRSPKQHIDAYTIATNAPATTDNPFPGFTKQMILCLKSEAAQGVAEVFNLLEHYGLRGSHTDGKGTYESVRKFVVAKSVNAIFAYISRGLKKDNLGLVSTMVRRAEVLRGMETAYSAGVFVLFLGFDWKSRIDKLTNVVFKGMLLALMIELDKPSADMEKIANKAALKTDNELTAHPGDRGLYFV